MTDFATRQARIEKQSVDQIIDARWVVPIEPDDTLLENHSLVVQDGYILDLLPTSESGRQYVGKRHFRLENHLLMPGLVNLHTHAAMSLLRGYADDMALMRWLQDHIWPAEARLVSPEFVRDGTLLASWEMLRGGITCFNDMYFFPAAAAEAALSAGIRAALGITVFDFPSAYGKDARDYLDKGLATRTDLQGKPLISFCLAPHAPYTVSDETFLKVAELARQLDLPVHIHLHETLDEIAGSMKAHGMRPLERLHRLGLLGPKLIAVHAVHLEPDEIGLLADHRCHVAHCPTSNLKLASGIASLGSMTKAGIGVGLGSDGAASNNRLDLLREMTLATLLAKVATHDAACLPASKILRMATLDGARALGLGHLIGSLLPGKAADLVAFELDEWYLQPCFDPISHLVYVAGREQASHVWVAGMLRIDNKKPVDLEIPALLDRVKLWQNKLT